MSNAVLWGEFAFREATGADLDALLLQRKRMFADMGYRDKTAVNAAAAASREFFEERIGDGRFHAWVVETSSQQIVAGGVVLILDRLPSPRDPHPRRPLIVNVYTEPEYRRRGIARKLMETMIAWCREEGFNSVTLYTSPDGRPLYESMGFTTTNEMRLMLR
jgi:GNAT superfamily N-acetyltransferase